MNNKEQEQVQKAFIQFLFEKTGAKSEKELAEYLKKLSKEELTKLQKEEFPKWIEEKSKQQKQEQEQQINSAKKGAKLNYLKQLKHQCAEDEELIYFKKGGIVECGCKKKKGGEIKEDSKMNAVEKFKARKGKKLPTAPEAKEAYDNGNYYSNANTVMDKIKGRKREIITGSISSAPRPRRMELTINKGDSTIVETPGNDGNVRVTKRTASSTDKDPKEWEILRRRWEEAKKVSDKRNKNGGKLKEEKCGGKMKKHENGKKITVTACGSKINKHEQGGSLNGVPFSL